MRSWHDAFRALTLSRTVGMGGASYIPLTEIHAYCCLAGVPQMEQLTFMRMIQRIDAAYLSVIHGDAKPLAQPVKE